MSLIFTPAARAAVVAAGLAAMLASSADAATITASTTGPTTVGIGDTVTIDLDMTGWTHGEVDAISFNLGFDPSVFSHSGSTTPPDSEILTTQPGSFIDHNQQGGATLVGTVDTSNVGGGVWGFVVEDTDIVSSPNTGATQASGSLGSVQFTASSVGSSTFLPGTATFLEPFDPGRLLFASPIMPSPLSLTGVTITVVPEPAACWLVAVGWGMIGRRRRIR